MATSYVPSREGEYSAFVKQFAGALADSPQTYGLTDEEVQTLQKHTEEWNQSFGDAVAAKDAAKAAIQTKALSQKELTTLVRSFSRRIQANDSVSDADRAKAGLPIHKTSRTPVAVPKTQPVGRVVSLGPLQQELHFSGDTHRGKPAGVIACRIHMHVGPTAPLNPQDYVFVAQTGRSPYRVLHETKDSGQIAHFILQWVNTREEVGPWSTPISCTVPAV